MRSTGGVRRPQFAAGATSPRTKLALLSGVIHLQLQLSSESVMTLGRDSKSGRKASFEKLMRSAGLRPLGGSQLRICGKTRSVVRGGCARMDEFTPSQKRSANSRACHRQLLRSLIGHFLSQVIGSVTPNRHH